MFALFLHFATQISVFYSQTSRHNYGCPIGLLADKRLTDLEISSQASGEQHADTPALSALRFLFHVLFTKGTPQVYQRFVCNEIFQSSQKNITLLHLDSVVG